MWSVTCCGDSMYLFVDITQLKTPSVVYTESKASYFGTDEHRTVDWINCRLSRLTSQCTYCHGASSPTVMLTSNWQNWGIFSTCLIIGPIPWRSPLSRVVVVDIDAQEACDSTASDICWMGVRRLVVANGSNIFQMLLVNNTDDGLRVNVT